MQELAVGNGEDFVEEVVVFAGDQYRCVARGGGLHGPWTLRAGDVVFWDVRDV